MSTPESIKQLSAHYKSARREHPTADAGEIADLILPRMTHEHLVALAADWMAMTNASGHDTRTTARGYIHNFVVAMDEPDDGF